MLTKTSLLIEYILLINRWWTFLNACGYATIMCDIFLSIKYCILKLAVLYTVQLFEYCHVNCLCFVNNIFAKIVWYLLFILSVNLLKTSTETETVDVNFLNVPGQFFFYLFITESSKYTQQQRPSYKRRNYEEKNIVESSTRACINFIINFYFLFTKFIP